MTGKSPKAGSDAARAQIFASLRRANLRGPLSEEAKAAVDGRLQNHPRGTIPARTDLDTDGLVALFETMAIEAAATVVHVDQWHDTAEAIAGYLADNNLPAVVKVAPDTDLDWAGWDRTPALSVTRGRGEGSDAVGVTKGFAGVAETGTLIMTSGTGQSTTLNYLPDTHIAVFRRGRIVGSYEDGWDLIRAAGAVPRSVNFITGPSRTADIEQKLQLGAHGPRRLHIVIVDSDA